jgi:hypothetical protein
MIAKFDRPFGLEFQRGAARLIFPPILKERAGTWEAIDEPAETLSAVSPCAPNFPPIGFSERG